MTRRRCQPREPREPRELKACTLSVIRLISIGDFFAEVSGLCGQPGRVLTEYGFRCKDHAPKPARKDKP